MELSDIFAQGITARQGQPRITLHIVDDESCPSCGRPGSPKVFDEDGTAHWKCLSSYDDCKIAYWVPGTRRIERKLDPAAHAAMAKRIHDEVTESLKNRTWICNCTPGGFISSSTTIPDGDPIPAGHHKLGEGCN